MKEITHIDLTLFRILIDLLILLIAYHFAVKDYFSLKERSLIKSFGETSGEGFNVFSAGPCKIESLFFQFQMERMSAFQDITVYFGIVISGAFNKMVLSLPFEVTRDFDDEIDGAQINGRKNDSSLIITDMREEREYFEIPNYYFTVNGCGRVEFGRNELFFSVSDPYASGKPYAGIRKYPMIHNGSVSEIYVPEIKIMEVVIGYLATTYRPDPERSFPSPDVVLGKDMRWHSGKEMRSHSSIRAAFKDDAALDNSNRESFVSSIRFALLSSVSVASGLDALWNIVVLI